MGTPILVSSDLPIIGSSDLPIIGSSDPPIIVSSDLPIIGENRCSRKWVNKREEPKFVPMKKSKVLRLH
jgi:hypothetical protein